MRHGRFVVLLALLVATVVGCLGGGRRAYFSNCSGDDQCESNLCWQNLCTKTCASADQCGPSATCLSDHCAPAKDIADASAAAQDSAVVGGRKQVFVTSKAYTAALGGLKGADALCQAHADAAKLGGTYKAWLSDDTASPVSRFSASCKAGGPFVLTDGTVIANDWAGLTSGTLLAALQVTETKGPPPGGNLCSSGKGSGTWTATLNNGEVDAGRIGMLCNNWTSGSLTLKASMLWGQPSDAKAWSSGGNCFLGGMTICSRVASLYCFEQ